MHTLIKRIIEEECIGKVWITTIEFDDGGEILQATGVGRNYKPHTPISVYLDDRYNRLKFNIDKPAHPTHEANE